MNEHRCAVCGAIIPQGRDVCWSCEHGHTPEIKENEEKENEEKQLDRR